MDNVKFKTLCKDFATNTGVAVLEGHEDESVMRWLAAGALTDEQKDLFCKMYKERN